MTKKVPRRWAATKDERLGRQLAESVEVGECLEWQGPFSCHGVTPVVKARNVEKERTDNFSVPRMLWEAAYGAIPAGKLVYRCCNNNACVLLDHLTIGTRKDWGKHRAKTAAAKHHNATKIALTIAARRRVNTKNDMDKARAVRSLRSEGVSRAQISIQTGVSEALVADICQGRRWVETGSVFAGLWTR